MRLQLPTACPVPTRAPAGVRSPGPAETSDGEQDWPEVPERVRKAARAAFDRRDRAAQVARLVCELWPQDPWMHPLHRLCFTSTDVSVTMDVVPSGAGLRLEVGVHPPAAVELEVRHSGPRLACRSDAHGRCVLEPVSPGLVSLLLSGGAPRTATAWTHL